MSANDGRHKPSSSCSLHHPKVQRSFRWTFFLMRSVAVSAYWCAKQELFCLFTIWTIHIHGLLSKTCSVMVVEKRRAMQASSYKETPPPHLWEPSLWIPFQNLRNGQISFRLEAGYDEFKSGRFLTAASLHINPPLTLQPPSHPAGGVRNTHSGQAAAVTRRNLAADHTVRLCVSFDSQNCGAARCTAGWAGMTGKR